MTTARLDTQILKTVRFDVRVDLTEAMLGTIPRNPELVERHVQRKAREGELASPESLAEELATAPMVEQEERSMWDGFHSDDGGLFVYNYLVKGHLKEAARALSKGADVSGLANKLSRCVFVSPRRIRMIRDGQAITVPDEIVERAVRILDRNGQRTALKRSDAVTSPASMSFTLEVIVPSQFAETPDRAEVLLRSMLDYARVVGYGEWRGAGYGTAEVSSFRRV